MIEPVTAQQMYSMYRRAAPNYAEIVVAPWVKIMARHAFESGVTVRDLKGRGRKRPLVHIRQDCMLKLREQTDLSIPQIGRLLNRDHTTVLWGLARARERRASQ